MLRSNWHLTMRRTIFEISAVKWPKFRPKISDLGDSPQKGRRFVLYHHAKFYADRRRDICNCMDREKKTATDVPFHTVSRHFIFVSLRFVRVLRWVWMNEWMTYGGWKCFRIKTGLWTWMKTEKDWTTFGQQSTTHGSRVPSNISDVQDLVLSQENEQTHRQISRGADVQLSSVNGIIHKDFGSDVPQEIPA